MRRTVFAASAVFALLACSQDAEAPVDSEVDPASTADGKVLSEDGRSLADPADQGPTRQATIPAAFQGTWDMAGSNCDEYSETRTEILQASIRFYESMGEVTGVEVDSPNRIVVSMSMEGEGESWQMARMFTLGDDGATLTPAAVDGEDQVAHVQLRKCAA